jgi:hypothetical protein
MLSDKARRSLAGMWGSYDARLIRDKHYLTASDMVEHFLELYEPRWESAPDYEQYGHLAKNPDEVRMLIEKWANDKLQRILLDESASTVQAHVMCKNIRYGNNLRISFGSVGNNWKTKAVIAEELSHYRPWSMLHAASYLGGVEQLYQHMNSIVLKTKSPTENTFFEAWWRLTDNIDRPMLFPQVTGAGATFWGPTPSGLRPLHFDFGFINVVTRTKIIVECDSRRYHSKDEDYELDRIRQNIAEEQGWSVRRFTYEHVTRDIDYCFSNLMPHLFYERSW